jgi:hypothetical protein
MGYRITEEKMETTINDLYLKYVNKVGKTLEKDRYFQYLFEMVQAGNHVLQQKNQVLHKVVDERWLSTIEESLDAINNIIDKPRRFIATKEEVVPVALAKKITADSVRHLSMNTQFIASSEDGDIQPTRILNVSTEESYDLYENRFIYHLIQRLVTFIDKRTDVIFWSTGDETKNTLSFQSKVDDAYEEIEYKLEMSVKNRQSFAENDSDNMNVFMRIDRVRRMVMALRHSSFCSLMAGCSKVRSPIQRTNLLMKDPNYRTCYKLWQFLESYDEVGYTIDVQDSALEFDEEYLLQLYTNLITNYTVFKSILEDRPRDLEEAASKKRKVIKPKFIKKIEEQIVDDYDIPDVEIRQVIIEEVTQAQLDAEAKLAEESEARKLAEEALEDLESQMGTLQQQIFSMMEMNTAAEERADQECKEKEAALEALEQEKQAKEAAEAQAEQKIIRLREEAAAEQNRLQTEAREREANLTAEAQAQAARLQAEAEERMARLQAEAEEQMACLQAEAEERINQVEIRAQKEIEQAEWQAAMVAESARAKVEAEAEHARVQIQEETTARYEAEAEAKQAREEQEEAEARARKLVAEAEAKAEALVAEAEAKAEALVAEMKEQMETSIAEAWSQTLQAQEKAEAEAQARKKAEEKAEANSLSKYIISAFNQHRENTGNKKQ